MCAVSFAPVNVLSVLHPVLYCIVHRVWVFIELSCDSCEPHVNRAIEVVEISKSQHHHLLDFTSGKFVIHPGVLSVHILFLYRFHFRFKQLAKFFDVLSVGLCLFEPSFIRRLLDSGLFARWTVRYLDLSLRFWHLKLYKVGARFNKRNLLI